jgi:cell division septal protein FtsQ
MFSLSGASKTKRRPRRSEMRLGRSYEQTVARQSVRVRSTDRTRSSAGRHSTVGIGPRVGSLLLALASLAALAYLFLSDSYYVFEVTLHGNSLVTTEEVFQRSEVEGYSIFFIDPVAIEERIRAIPDVREATVQVSLPNVMVIDVQERQARAVWQTGDDRYGVDDEGTAVSLREGAEPSIVIRDLDSTPLELGARVNLEALTAAETFQSLLPSVTDFDYSREHGISYLDHHGWRVYLGSEQGAELKVAVLDALVNQLESQAAAVELIDVRFPESPLYELAETSAPESES